MESLTVSRSREDTLTVVKAALEIADPISTYRVDGETITAKTGHRPLHFRFGSVITIEVPGDQQTVSETLLVISEEVDAGLKFRSRSNFRPEDSVFDAIENLEEIPIQKIEQDLDRQYSGSRSKEVDRPRDQVGGKLKAALLSGLYALLGSVLMLVVLFALSP
ncbi:hypothetical protein [Halococcoides cellulosivorans]|uniref:Uncharacterized protein n=1 Tax=Halococcoides cellulosivorans TaxID=1679096 RepID=A0A2R4X1H5_9EURY|nr:hypothetical protein [Halococcoides cellulosivorans]AWB27639.1 hypothetical protein HARCEL1_07920 [Halococcoides cellulosivorans]